MFAVTLKAVLFFSYFQEKIFLFRLGAGRHPMTSLNVLTQSHPGPATKGFYLPLLTRQTEEEKGGGSHIR
jgi:hypothetical protein